MILVDQTEFSGPGTHGNCLSACLASLTGLPIAELPNFSKMYAETGSWFPEFTSLLRLHGMEYQGTYYLGPGSTWEGLLERSPGIDGCFIVGGKSPRGVKGGHAVIYKDGQLLHDPHPSREGLTEAEDVMMIERV